MAIVEHPDEMPCLTTVMPATAATAIPFISGQTLTQITLAQILNLPRQESKCPANCATVEPFDKRTGLTSDQFLSCGWSAARQEYIKNSVFLVRQVENKNVKLQAGYKEVTNVLAVTSGMQELQISAWESYAPLLASCEVNRV